MFVTLSVDKEQRMGFADLHIHSLYSHDGTASITAILKYVADKTDLKVIAITDHDTMKGVIEAQDFAPRYNLEVIPGCEISSKDGHVLGLFIDRPIPPGLSLLETVLRVGERGGICIAAHPMAKGITSLKLETIRKTLLDPQAINVLVGVEALNSGLVYKRNNHRVEEKCRTLPLAQVGNSDAHILRMIGQAATFFNGHTSLELRWALENHLTSPRKVKGLSGSMVVMSYIPQFFLRKLGWVSWNKNPETPIVYANLNKLISTRSLTQISQS
jgi:predicted metal-dependent phosphoesterase TrpH